MAGERKLAGPVEDPYVRGVRGIPGRQHEGRLGVIELRGDRLHLLGGEPARVGNDGERVARERPIGEDVDREVGVAHRLVMPASMISVWPVTQRASSLAR